MADQPIVVFFTPDLELEWEVGPDSEVVFTPAPDVDAGVDTKPADG